MAKGSKKGGGVTPRWMRHRALIAAESVLLVGVGQKLLSEWLESVPMPNGARIAMTMAMTLGVLGSLVLFAKGMTSKGVEQTAEVAKALPLPASTWLFHVAAFFGLFCLYAVVWHLPFTLWGTEAVIGTEKPD